MNSIRTALIVIFFLTHALNTQYASAPHLDFVAIENGIWEQEGYGRIIEITEKKVSVYDVCKVSCVPSMEIPRNMLDMFGKITNVSDTHMTVSGGINLYEFNRLDEMPELCKQKMSKKKRKNAVYNFESLWHTFNEQYCSFEKRNIDWNSYRDKYQSKITSKTSELDLYIILEEMLNSMNDGHVWIGLPDHLEKAYEAQKPSDAASNDLDSGQMTISDLRRDVRWGLRDRYIPNYKQYHKGLIRWGMTKEKVAYVQINAMEYFADYKIDENLDIEEYLEFYGNLTDKSTNPFEELVAGAEMIMDSIIRDMQGAQAYILDIRFNGGGTDEVSIEIMNRFTKERMKVFSKKARLGKGFTKPNEVFVEPSEITFTSGPVFVLTSGGTASAAEIMTMCAKAMPNVTIVGSHTMGIFSDILDKKLPNGWTYGVSNEVYQTLDGKNWEGIGIPPDVDLKYPRDGRAFIQLLYDGMKNGDPAIEECLGIMKGNR